MRALRGISGQVPISIMAYFPVMKSLLAAVYCCTASTLAP
jgi:hypothetical protein